MTPARCHFLVGQPGLSGKIHRLDDVLNQNHAFVMTLRQRYLPTKDEERLKLHKCRRLLERPNNTFGHHRPNTQHHFQGLPAYTGAFNQPLLPPQLYSFVSNGSKIPSARMDCSSDKITAPARAVDR